MKRQFDWGKPVPVDVFVHSLGEPRNRFATKIGGLPYRPAKALWPETSEGRPMALIAQFNFANSRDIVGKLPGDLLLVFGDDSDGIVKALHFEWQNLGLSDLVTKLPKGTMAITPCFGNRCRTVSYPKAKPNFPIEDDPKYRRIEVRSAYLLPQYQATQIGRAPFFIQDGDSELPGSPLCTISSVQPTSQKRYQWVNRPRPRSDDPKPYGSEDHFLMIGDLGCIYIFMDRAGKLHTDESCF